MTNFRHNQIECFCRRQNKSGSEIEIWNEKDRYNCGKGGNVDKQYFLLFQENIVGKGENAD